jgi:DNA repair protein RecO (recombination protein O)
VVRAPPQSARQNRKSFLVLFFKKEHSSFCFLMELTAAAILLSAAPFGEGDAVASVFTEPHGIYRGLVRGGLSRARAATWQTGNLLEIRWVARLADQLGSLTGELVHASAALAMDDPWSLATLMSVCAVAEGALPERAAHAAIFRGLLHLIAHNGEGAGLLPDIVRWELGLLADLGYGLDLSCCAVTRSAENLIYVSPRTGRAVSAEAAGQWSERLLRLPPFLLNDTAGDAAQWADGLRLTAHFLARDAFGHQNKPLPAARRALEERAGREAR